MRTFIAISLPADLKAQLALVQGRLKTAVGERIRWTPVEQMHLTLVFLGDVPEDRLDELGGVLERTCAGAPPFRLRPEGLGCFPDLRRPRIIWVGITGEVERLSWLQQEVARVTAGFGDNQERHAFHPHLTLGRVKDRAVRETRGLAQGLEDESVRRGGEWVVGEIALMRSDLGPHGPRHTELAQFPLSNDYCGI